jgi:hypothetical protein
MPPLIYDLIKKPKTVIAWQEHAELTDPCASADR